MKNLLALLLIIAIVPACKKQQPVAPQHHVKEITERVSGPAGWDLAEEELNIK